METSGGMLHCGTNGTPLLALEMSVLMTLMSVSNQASQQAGVHVHIGIDMLLHVQAVDKHGALAMKTRYPPRDPPPQPRVYVRLR